MEILFEVQRGALKCDCLVLRERDRMKERQTERALLALFPSNPLCATPGWHINDGKMT